MKFRHLLAFLQGMDEEELDEDITIETEDGNYITITSIKFIEDMGWYLVED